MIRRRRIALVVCATLIGAVGGLQAPPAAAHDRRDYSVKHETSEGNYVRAKHVIRHLSLTGPGTGATVRMVCGASTVTGEIRMALQNLWVNFSDTHWMETSAAYHCGSDGIYRSRVRYEYHHTGQNINEINYYGNFFDTSTHEYMIFHSSGDGAARWSWFYDGIRMDSRYWSSGHAPHAINVRDGLETNEPSTELFVGRHQYDTLAYGTSDANSSFVAANYDSTHYDPGTTWFERVSGSNHFGCETRQNTCG